MHARVRNFLMLERKDCAGGRLLRNKTTDAIPVVRTEQRLTKMMEFIFSCFVVSYLPVVRTYKGMI